MTEKMPHNKPEHIPEWKKNLKPITAENIKDRIEEANLRLRAILEAREIEEAQRLRDFQKLEEDNNIIFKSS